MLDSRLFLKGQTNLHFSAASRSQVTGRISTHGILHCFVLSQYGTLIKNVFRSTRIPVFQCACKWSNNSPRPVYHDTFTVKRIGLAAFSFSCETTTTVQPSIGYIVRSMGCANNLSNGTQWLIWGWRPDHPPPPVNTRGIFALVPLGPKYFPFRISASTLSF